MVKVTLQHLSIVVEDENKFLENLEGFLCTQSNDWFFKVGDTFDDQELALEDELEPELEWV